MRVFIGVLVALAVVFGTPLIFWGPQITHAWALGLTGGAAFFIFALGFLVLIGVGIVSRGWVLGLVVTGGLALIALAAVTGIRFDYDVNSVYAKDVKLVEQSLPDFAERAPFDVASASSTKNLGDTTGEAKNVKILADEGDHGTWTALVQRRGFMAGYESVQSIEVPLFGAAGSDVTDTCDFNVEQAEQRMGGIWASESLDHMVLRATPLSVTFDEADAYSYCDGKKPVVVMPLKQLSGFWTAHWAAFGAAVYDGETGQVTIHTDTSDIPGPVYPQSLAIVQRQALTALGSFDDYWFNRSGFENTDGAQGDPNGGNASEFTLPYLDGRDAAYVTPLTPRGSSTSVTAVSATDATIAKSGARNTLTVYKYKQGESRTANSSIAQEIKNAYSFMPDWASGLQIFEIVPAADGKWVASIGQTQSVVYRAVVDKKGQAVLYDENGDEVTRTGARPGKPSTGGTTSSGDVQDMTVDELHALATSILDELAARTATK